MPGQDDPLPDLELAPKEVTTNKSFLEYKAELAEFLQMNASVIKGIRAGDYTAEQIEKLIKQKEKVIQTINAKENPSSTDTPPDTIDQTQNIIASVGATIPASVRARGLTELSNGSAGTKSPSCNDVNPMSKPRTTCSFQVCHTCRPFWKDRPYSSFEAVLEGEAQPLSAVDFQFLPVMNRDLMLNVGLRKQPTPPLASGQTIYSTDNMFDQYDVDRDEDDISVDWTSDTNGESDSSGSDHLDSSHLYPCPGALQCPVYSRHSGCAYDSGFDDGRRAVNHGFLAEHHFDRHTPDNSRSHLHRLMTNIADTPGGSSSTASTLSLPTPTTAPLAPLLPTDDTFDIALKKQLGKVAKAKSVGDEIGKEKENRKMELHARESNSSLGSEIEVAGGVALKEEAVERGVPDIITDK